MIKLEGQTGALQLTFQHEVVKISFDNGSIIYAEGLPAVDGARIRNTLVRNQLIKTADWNHIQREHDTKLKTYWEILERVLQIDIVKELVNRQIIENLFFALRLKQGEYNFTAVKGMRYNKEIMTPLDIDSILIEGCRVADEWDIKFGKLPNVTKTIKKSILSNKSENVLGQRWIASEERAQLNDDNIALTDSEIAVLSVIGKGFTVEEILSSARVDKFEAMLALESLFHKRLIKTADSSSRRYNIGFGLVHLFWIAVSILLIGAIYGGLMLNKDKALQFLKMKDELPYNILRDQVDFELHEIKKAIIIYYTLHGKLPTNLDELTELSSKGENLLIDPWGRRYLFESKLEPLYSSVIFLSQGPDIENPQDDIILKLNSNKSQNNDEAGKSQNKDSKERLGGSRL